MKSRKQFSTAADRDSGGITSGKNPVEPHIDNVPKLEFAFSVNITLGKLEDLGITPHGHRRMISITGGIFKGPAIEGTVEPGGADWQIIRADKVAELNALYILKTNDGALIYINNRGYRYGSAEVLQRIERGEAVEANEYYFRATPIFETASAKYDYLNKNIYVASAEQKKKV